MTTRTIAVSQRRAFLKLLAGSPVAAYPSLLAYSDEMQRRISEPGLDSPIGERIIDSPWDAISVFDFEVVARKTLPAAHFEYMAWGAEGGSTLQANREGFKRVELRPRRLVDVTQVDTTTELFGKAWKTPIILAPTGSEKAFHPEGAIAAARAARSKQHLQILSTVSTSSIEEVTEATGSPIWYQLYPTSRWSISQELLRRAEAAGCPAVAVTVDTPIGGAVGDVWKEAKYLDSRDCSACHVRTLQGYARRKPMFDGLDLEGLKNVSAPNLTWDIVRRIKDSTRMKVLLKGIVTREDAQLCVAEGVDGIIVSNHGGRSEGGGRATIASLPEVVVGVEGRIPVLVDGGFRHGSDVFKALALGAQAICVGRPYLWGLAAFGQPGVEAVLDILRQELERSMMICGARSIREIGAAHVRVT